jgi:hypothetical protein
VKKAYSQEAHEKRVQLKQWVAVIRTMVLKNTSSVLMNELSEPVQLFRTFVGAHIHSLAGHFLNRKQAGSLILGMSPEILPLQPTTVKLFAKKLVHLLMKKVSHLHIPTQCSGWYTSTMVFLVEI